MAKVPPKADALANWDEELAKQADIAATMEESAGGGQFFGTKSGILTWQDAPLKDNQMAVIIVDHILENVYYEGAFEANTPQAPKCFAHGRVEEELKPHLTVFNAKQQQHDTCKGCPKNEWGSALTGKGKACRNTRRLAMISAGTFVNGKFELLDDADHFKTAPLGFMKLSVTSVKGFAGYVKQVAGSLRRPPHGVITKVKVIPDQKTQFKIIFEAVEKVPNELMGVIMARNKEARAVIEFPYSLGQDEPAAPQSRKPPAKKKY